MHVLLIGCGSIGKGLLSLFQKHRRQLGVSAITVIDPNAQCCAFATQHCVLVPCNTVQNALTPTNYVNVLNACNLQPLDFVVNVSVEVSSCALIEYCMQHELLYIDTCNEDWPGEGKYDAFIPMHRRTNYLDRVHMESLFGNRKGTTCISCHGANPGLISHMVKRALQLLCTPSNKKSTLSYAEMARNAGVKCVIVAERDTQQSSLHHTRKFVNTWSVDGLVEEGYMQPACFSLGTHDSMPIDAAVQSSQVSNMACFPDKCGFQVRVRSWVPCFSSTRGQSCSSIENKGEHVAYMIDHDEVATIARMLTLSNKSYSPTVYYAYRPCDETVASIERFMEKYDADEEHNRMPSIAEQEVLIDTLNAGRDSLGVLLLGNDLGHDGNGYTAFWYGSRLSIKDARLVSEHQNATGLQVTASVLAAMLWALEHPYDGLVSVEDIDSDFVLDFCVKYGYLGDVQAAFSRWSPSPTFQLNDFIC